MGIPQPHVDFLWRLKNEYKFIPKIVYDIGACKMEWTKEATNIWAHSRYYLVDAYAPFQTLYKQSDHAYAIALLSDVSDKNVKFYENENYPSGNSYYREVYFKDTFPENRYTLKNTITLDKLVKKHGWAKPDLIKIDVQGAEMDVLKGATEIIGCVKYLIVEMQSEEYNKGAPRANETLKYIETLGFKCIAHKFSDNGPDADYCFVREN